MSQIAPRSYTKYTSENYVSIYLLSSPIKSNMGLWLILFQWHDILYNFKNPCQLWPHLCMCWMWRSILLHQCLKMFWSLADMLFYFELIMKSCFYIKNITIICPYSTYIRYHVLYTSCSVCYCFKFIYIWRITTYFTGECSCYCYKVWGGNPCEELIPIRAYILTIFVYLWKLVYKRFCI